MPVVHPSERPLFLASLAVSAAVYLALAVFATQLLAWSAGLLAVSALLLGWSLGSIRANGVRVSSEQLPEVHAIAVDLAARMGLGELPAIYVIQEGGALNAFATKFVRRDFIVLYSDVVDLALEQGEAELAFVIAHELAHVKRRHPLWSWVLSGSRLVPFLGPAYSRACEYTCDAMAAELRPDGAPGGLLVLAAGKRLYRNVNAQVFADQRRTETGCWIAVTEALASHPSLPRRVAALASRQAVGDRGASAPVAA